MIWNHRKDLRPFSPHESSHKYSGGQIYLVIIFPLPCNIVCILTKYQNLECRYIGLSVIVQGGTTPLHIGKRHGHIVNQRSHQKELIFWDIVPKRGGWVLEKNTMSEILFYKKFGQCTNVLIRFIFHLNNRKIKEEEKFLQCSGWVDVTVCAVVAAGSFFVIRITVPAPLHRSLSGILFQIIQWRGRGRSLDTLDTEGSQHSSKKKDQYTQIITMIMAQGTMLLLFRLVSILFFRTFLRFP